MEEKIERTFIRQTAYLKLRNWILEGTLCPGALLKDKELAAQLGVSRTPIREALLRLEDEGLVQTKPNSATRVTSIDFHWAFHLYSMVWTLERLALSQAFGALHPTDIPHMIEANEQFLHYMQLGDRLAALNADYRFHSIYIQRAQNLDLEKILFEIKNKLKRLDLYYFNKVKNAEISYEEHLTLIKALQEKNLPASLDAVEANWKNSFARFEIGENYV